MSSMSAETRMKEYIERSYSSVFTNKVKTYDRNSIPEKKLKAVLEAVAPGVLKEAIIVYVDSTLFGKGDDGYLITTQSFYVKDLLDNSLRIPFKDINKVSTDKKSNVIVEYNGCSVSISKNHVNSSLAIKFFKDIQKIYIEFEQQGLAPLNDRVLTLEEMSEDVKLSYIKSLIDYEKSITNEVLSAPFAEIMGLMTQLNFSKEMRREVKKYILSESSPITINYRKMISNTPRGNIKNIKISLLKDMIRTTRARDKLNVMKNKDIQTLQTLFCVENFLEVIELLEKSIISDEKLIAGEISEKEYIENFKNLAASGAAIGVPIVAIYMAGSVVGLSAAGITSGLAALGFGGLLGFSSMITGIGVLIVGGVAGYYTVKYVTDEKQSVLKSMREKMIKEVILMHQATINNLLEDVEDYTEKINQLYEDKEANALAIAELNQQMRLFKDTLLSVQTRENKFSAELEMV